MIPTSFKESNLVFGPPEGMKEGVDCDSLAVYVNEERTLVISCWKLTQEEIDSLVKGGRLWLMVHGRSMPPVSLGTETPFVQG